MSGSARTKVLLVDSHHISLTGLHTILDNCPDLYVAGVAQDDSAAGALYREVRPDVAVVNTHAHTSEALASITALSEAHPTLPPPNILVLVNNVDDDTEQVLKAGAKGLLSSRCSSQELAAAVRIMATGRSLLIPMGGEAKGCSPLGQLTDREVEVFRLVTRGYTNAEISTLLTLRESTVKSHIQRIMEKLGLRNRVQAVIFAYEKNIVHARS